MRRGPRAVTSGRRSFGCLTIEYRFACLGARLQLRARLQRVAALHGGALPPRLGTALAPRGGAGGERVRDRVPLPLLLQPVAANRRSLFHSGLDVARLDQVPFL